MSVSEHEEVEKQHTHIPQKVRRPLKPFRYLMLPKRDISTPYLVRERTRCGKPSCRCQRGLRHGPYWFLRYEFWDRGARHERYVREYVPKAELGRVRRWVQRFRAKDARSRAFLSLLRRSVRGVEARERQKARSASVVVRWGDGTPP